MTAYSAGALDAKGVHDASDLPKLTPGLTITTQVGFTSTFLRGCGSDAFILGDPYVATYVDGVYYPFALGSIQDFGTIDRIEVLKGPQGTLFGRNALCGAIRIITRVSEQQRKAVERTYLMIQGEAVVPVRYALLGVFNQRFAFEFSTGSAVVSDGRRCADRRSLEVGIQQRAVAQKA